MDWRRRWAGPTSAAELGLAATGRTMPQLFRNNGYATALIGKWHLGYKPEFSPNAHGFDYFFGLKSGYHDFYQHTGSGGKPDLWENDRLIDVSGYTTDLITERALKFIEQNTNRPFFVDVAYNAPHWPYQPPDKPSVAARNGAHVRPGDMPISTASILAATGATVLPETRLDGVNLFPVWEGKSPKTERTLFWRTGVGGHSRKAVRSGDFKLVMDGNHTFVFDIPNDAGERHDLAQRRQDVAQKLRALLAEWERDVDAEAKAAKLPTPGRR